METVQSTDGKENALFVMNHNDYPLVVPLDKEFTEMITGIKIEEAITIEPYGVVILKELN